MIKKAGKYLFLISIALSVACFLWIGKTQAAGNPPAQTVVINELMWMGSSSHSADEWIELRNMTGSDIVFSKTPYSLYINDVLKVVINTGTIKGNGFYLIANRPKNFVFNNGNISILNLDPDLVRNSSSTFLPNSDVQYKLFDKIDNTGELVDIADDGSGPPLAGENSSTVRASMERNFIPGDGKLLENWHTSSSIISFTPTVENRGTPRSENSSVPIVIPKLTSPEHGKNFFGDATFDFEWEEETDLNYQLVVSKNNDPFSNPISDISNLAKGKYYWGVLVSNDRETKKSDIWSFELKDYPKTVIINEICPHPSGGTDNEFIELYNSGSEAVDISGWFLDDIDGGSKPYQIPSNTVIGAGQYKAFYRSITGIVLNDDGDSARLLFPNGDEANSISYDEYAPLGYSWARKTNNTWVWTTTPTFGDVNKITLPVEETTSTAENSEPINTAPIEIPTGDFKNYLNKLVKVTGEVTSTSGDTFYLDDGSGEAKIYIQSKTNIDKPAMHKGDIFQVTGIVDLYGSSNWRILPQNQDDILLVEATLAAASTTKKTTAKKAAASSTSSSSKSSSNSTKKVAAATSSDNGGDNNSSNQKTPFWIELIEAILGLALIFLVIFIIKIWRTPKPKIIGGHFGDDET